MLLLTCSSLVFIIPAIVARRKKRKFDALACSCLTGTSILFHGIGHWWMYVLDAFLAHSMVIGYTLKGIELFLKTKNILYMSGCLNSILAAALYVSNTITFKKDTLHTFVQLNGLVAILNYISASESIA